MTRVISTETSCRKSAFLQGRFYQALKLTHKLIEYEQEAIGNVHSAT